MKYYKIEKFFKGGSVTYFAKLRDSRIINKTCVNYQLEQWGDSTDGGHNYGYRIEMKRIHKLPKGMKTSLQFNEDYLVKKMKKRNKKNAEIKRIK